jgi:hypothetical protein
MIAVLLAIPLAAFATRLERLPVGVVLVGELLGALGLIIAVPLMVLIVILVEEVWVKPMEESGPGVIELPSLAGSAAEAEAGPRPAPTLRVT